MNGYLHGRLQEIKVDLLFNSELDILYVGSQGSIYGRLSFDLYTFDVKLTNHDKLTNNIEGKCLRALLFVVTL